jgi:DNA primase
MSSVTSTEKIRFLRGIFRDIQVSRDGNDVAVPCPNCKTDDKKKLSVNITTWKYHCWVCGIKGNNLRSVFKQYHSPEVLAAFKSQFGIGDEASNVEVPIDIVELPEGIIPVPLVKTSKNPNHRACYAYLHRRGISERDMWYWKMCISKENRFDRRVIIPSFDASGDLNYYVSRTIDDDARPRYINSKANKTEIIFNDLMVDWTQPVVLVEGVFDAVRIGQNAIPILGSYLPQSAALFTKIVANGLQVTLALDPDVIDKSHKIAQDFFSFGIDVRIADIAGYKDVGEMTRDVARQRINDATQWVKKTGILHRISKISSGSIL